MKTVQQINYLTIKEHEGKYYVYDIKKELQLTTVSKDEAFQFCLDKPKRLDEILKNAFKEIENKNEV